MYLNVTVNDKQLKMEIDTGSYATIMSKKDKDKYFPEIKIKTSNIPLKAYGKVPLEQEGIIDELTVIIGRKKTKLSMIVMKGNGPILIGRQWLKIFELWPFDIKDNEKNKINNKVDYCNKINPLNIVKDFTNKFPKLFGKGPGLYNKGMLKLTVKKDARPVALKARHLPFALANKVEDEINRLESLGHLEKIDVSGQHR